jgi:3-methylcrotonyl-CoA carboxylase alpha subunit
MFSKLLIANRGEIACRVMRTAKRLGLATVAVHSEADAGGLHVAMADEAHAIGPPPAADSYLDIDAIVAAARASGADAVHPGYGFLAENADFAEAVAAEGLVFVGPPAAAIRAMGSKSAAKEIMKEAGVPLVPGYQGEAQNLKTLRAAARKVGYPVLVKASAGGGGKGMRVVEKAGGLADAVASARREAASAFGDDRLLIEKLIEGARHVEVQVFADSHDNAVHLFERDCSVQRRHQKIIEEAPAPAMTASLRRRMGGAAVAAARAISYVGAGTVEFLLDGEGDFFFMEMNTRLQVEHAVTEMVTGHDLVEWQLRVAAGEPLPAAQDDLHLNGHAIEARLYAEDPGRGFLPSVGTVTHLRLPPESAHVRVDSGVGEGDEVTIHYDPMIAKLIVWDTGRDAAVGRLRAALAETQIVGPATNVDFLAAVAAHPAFQAGALDTGFVERHLDDLLPAHEPAPDRILALACLEVLLRRAQGARWAARLSSDPHSPWNATDGWRLNGDSHDVLTFGDDGGEVAVTIHYRGGGFQFDLPSGPLIAAGEIDGGGELAADLGGERLRATVVRHGDSLSVLSGGTSHRLVVIDPAARAARQEGPQGGLGAPMPGKVIAVLVEPGQDVKRGATLMVLEAMKMEHAITAPADGTVAAVHFKVGEQVEEGVELLAFEGGG